MVRNIWCLGRSYSAHAKELGNEIPDSPLVFLKAGSCLVPEGDDIYLPNKTDEIHHEVEMALLVGKKLEITHYSVGIDLTNRTQQNRLKEKSHAWTLAKSFKNSCPIGKWHEATNVNLDALDISLKVNGKTKQAANTSELLLNCTQILIYIKEHFPVCPGDIIMTGTPSGVAKIQSGDFIEAQVASVKAQWKVT